MIEPPVACKVTGTDGEMFPQNEASTNIEQELKLAAKIGSSLLEENQTLKTALEVSKAQLEEYKLNAETTTSKNIVLEGRCRTLKQKLTELETCMRQHTNHKEKNMGLICNLAETKIRSVTPTEDCNLQQQQMAELKRKLEDAVNFKYLLEIQLENLKEEVKNYMDEEERRVREELVQLREEEASRVFEETKRAIEHDDALATIEKLKRESISYIEENKILSAQAGELRAIITAKQFEKDEVVEQCRQIQLQTTMLLINAGKFDRDSKAADPPFTPQSKKSKTASAGTASNSGSNSATIPVETRKRRKSLVEQIEDNNARRAAQQEVLQRDIKREKREILQMLLAILRKQGVSAADTTDTTDTDKRGLSMAELSGHIKQASGKGWGGNWGKRHGALLQFLKKHPGLFDVNLRSGVTLRL
jgi:regulator of replication initiation timing